MEVQIRFPGLRALLSYESEETLELNDRVIVLTGARARQWGTVAVLKRGAFKGRLEKVRKVTDLDIRAARAVMEEERLHEDRIFNM